MSISKNVLKTYKTCCYLNNILGKRTVNVFSFRKTYEEQFNKSRYFFNPKKFSSYDSTSSTGVEEVIGIYPFIENQPLSKLEAARNALFNLNDQKITEIGKCASVEDIFNFVRINADELTYQHLARIVLALYDLQNIFVYHYEEVDDDVEIKETFFKKLLEHREFFIVTKAIENALDSFNPLFLSYTGLYLNRLGVTEESQLIQNIALKLRDQLLNEFSLNITSRLLRFVVLENSIRSYYVVIDLIPKIFGQIEQIKTVKDLEDLTICLYKLNTFLNDDVLTRYEAKVSELIKERTLTGADYQIILKTMSIFNFPKWRNQYCSTISNCILLMRDSIDSLTLMEMHHLYSIFIKNQEPGDILNIIQRAAAKLLHEIDDNRVNQKNKLRLFASVIYFCPPVNKEQFRQDVENYISEKATLSSMITLRRIFSSLKISDPKLCELFWNRSCQVLKAEKNIDNIVRLMDNYVYFCAELNGFHHHAFEHHTLALIEKYLDAGSLTLFPSRLFPALCFTLVCCYNPKLLDKLINSFSQLGTQMSPIDIFKMSQTLLIARQRKSIVTAKQLDKIKKVLHKATARLYSYPNLAPSISALLVKASILRNEYENELIDDMLTNMKNSKYLSSIIMEYMCFNLFSTSTLIPEVVNLCTTYIVDRKSNIVGFRAEKMSSLLYKLNYQPVYEEEFFETVTDIIIRDQERLSGLGFLQAALSLCFFNRMPRTFIKQIFNVEFLDKLDAELANCYFRERYPQRVRHTLMQLNRAVCLECPEYNVPWFHQKYIEEYHKTKPSDDVVNHFHRSVKAYLTGILGKESILENIITPYGYDIHFVVHLDKNKKPTSDFEHPNTTKLALLLANERTYTRFYVRLKGKHALKIRHLEILGYKVKMIKLTEWVNLLYAKERVQFIEELVS